MKSRRRSCLTTMAALVAMVASNTDAAPRLRHCRNCYPRSFLFEPYFDNGFYPPAIEEEPPSGYPPIFNFPEDQPPEVLEPTPRLPDSPYPQGFVLDVMTPTSDSGEVVNKSGIQLNRYREVADALAQCWHPPASFAGVRWQQATLRVSFKRDGTVNGMPRIPYVSEGLTPGARSDLTQSLMAGLHRCTPLNLSPGLGAAIAGQIFALRFIEQDPQK